jgi:hypothetical protein
MIQWRLMSWALALPAFRIVIVLRAGADRDVVVLFLGHAVDCTGWGDAYRNSFGSLGIECASP